MKKIKEVLLKNKKKVVIVAIISTIITSLSIYYQVKNGEKVNLIGSTIIFIFSAIGCFFFEKQMKSNYNGIKKIIKSFKRKKKIKKEEEPKYEIKTKGSKGGKNEKDRNRIKQNNSRNRITKEDER